MDSLSFDIQTSGMPGPAGPKGGGRDIYATWSALSAASGFPAGYTAEVPLSDNAAHTDPVVGGTVSNSGVYSYSTSPAGWLRVGDVDALSAKPFADAAAASAAQIAANENKRKFEILLASLAAGDIRRGIVNLADYGITDWPNPFDVKLYWTGAELYPMKKVDSTFNVGWIDGNILWIDPANGDRYRSVSVPKMNDPALDASITLTDFHCDWAGGLDTNPGTFASRFKTLDKGIAAAKAANVPFRIYAYGNIIGTSSLGVSASNTIPDTLKGKIVGVPTSGRWTWIAPVRDSIALANFGWVYEGSGTWSCSAAAVTIPDNVKKAPAWVDALNVDEDGCPVPTTFIASGVDLATTKANAQALPGSTSWFGTTGTGLTLFAHPIDGRQPDPANFWYADQSGVGPAMCQWLIGEGAKLYLDKIARFNYASNSTLFAGQRARQLAVPVDGVQNTGEFWMHDFGIVGSSGPGAQIYNLRRFGWDYGVIKHCFQDAENLHNFNSAASGAGNYQAGWSWFVKMDYIGRTTFGSAPASTESNQISSVHDQVWFQRANIVGGNTRGATIADVLGAQTLSINCHPHDPNHVASGPPGVGSPLTAFWCDGAGGGPTGPAIMRTLGCSGKAPAGANIFSATNGGIIRHAKTIGAKTAETYNAGVVTDLG